LAWAYTGRKPCYADLYPPILRERILMEQQQVPEQTHDEAYGLAAKEELAIQALLSNPTLKKAAAAAGISDTTLWRWLRKDNFRKAYIDARRKVVQQSLARIQQLTADAPAALHSIMLDESQNGTTRIAAAKAILEHAIKAVELEDHG